MKIRGNTISTTMNPDKIADRIGGGISEEDFCTLLENNIDSVMEKIIASLPVYSGEVVE